MKRFEFGELRRSYYTGDLNFYSNHKLRQSFKLTHIVSALQYLSEEGWEIKHSFEDEENANQRVVWLQKEISNDD